MPRKDPRIDAYITRAAEFARPILRHLRAVVHEACPAAEETIKWGSPAFDYQGPLCGMAAFKQHAVFGFWKGKLIVDGSGREVDAAMGQFGRLTSLADLPAKRELVRYVKLAMALNESGVKVPRPAKRKPPLPVPADLAAALRRNRKAQAAFAAFPPGCRREYVEWVTEAKREATRAQRIATTVAWVAEGKKRNWKYESRK
ncbi:MAG TPA: YdeI/OmpD-associated family protein [Candidatus Eisenbacteria bacterium]|jgi:uncharacterized protein YdeI (YjbR/CyaY-like superfamily)